jgi:hypothetical protein
MKFLSLEERGEEMRVAEEIKAVAGTIRLAHEQGRPECFGRPSHGSTNPAGRTNRRVAVVIATALATLPIGPAWAANITLFNTGVDSSGNLLVGGNGTVDGHYTIFSTTDPTATLGASAVTYNFPYPIAETTSRWLATTASGGGGGVTTFRQSFDLTGFDPATASITGQAAADNSMRIFLNGNLVVANASSSFSTFTPWMISSGFVAGVNTLDFELTDRGVPGAFNINNLVGTAERQVVGAVPEPATWAMMILGFGAIGASMRRRRPSMLTQLT